jgi:hypothetical protein
MLRRTMWAAALLAMFTVPATLRAQAPGDLVRPINRSGPRFGLTFLGGSIRDSIRSKYDVSVSPIITQFGWQFEKQFLSLEGGPVALSDVILLVGGMDQGTYIPSLTWLVGVRTPNNFEFGVGPNATPAGIALAITAGETFRSGALAIPVNVAIVPSRFGVRASVLTGFNLYR